MNPIEILVEALKSFGLPGIFAALAILIIVFVAKRAGLVATGDHARIANLLVSAAIYALGDNPQAEGALMAVISSLLAALSYEGLDYLNNRRLNK